MNKKLFSIILVNYRSVDVLDRWFRSLEHINTNPSAAAFSPSLRRGEGRGGVIQNLSTSYEIIIANNDAEEADQLDQLSKHHSFRVIHFKENLGFGTAINRVAPLAQGRFLVFCNPDTEFLSGNLYDAAKLFEAEGISSSPQMRGGKGGVVNNVGIVGFRLVTPHKTAERWSVGTDVSLWEIIRNNLGFPPGKKLWESEKTCEVGRVSGGALMIPREFFQELGGFDENFFLYFEDADLCRRVRQTDRRVLHYPRIILRHQGSHSMPSLTDQKRHYFASQTYYFRKHRPKWESQILHLLHKFFGIR